MNADSDVRTNFETKLPPLWNMNRGNFALISLGTKVKAPSAIPVS